MSLSRRKRKGNISMGKLPPPVGFQIMPASAGGGTNAAAMRPTFSFLQTNADELNKRIYTAKASWLSLNPTKGDADFIGIDDPYGTRQKLGVGANVLAQQALDAEKAACSGGQIWASWNSRCECPNGTHNKDGICVTDNKQIPDRWG